MRRLLFLTTLMSASLSWGQKQPCPIEIKSTISNYLVPTRVDPWNSALRIEYVNQAPLATKAIKFGVRFVDPMGDHEESVFYYIDNDQLKAGKARKGDWSDGVYTHGQRGLKALAWVESIAFSDSSVWRDDGTRSCGLLNLETQPKAYQPPPAMSEADKNAVEANMAAMKDSPAHAAAEKEHPATPEELQSLVKAGKASVCSIITNPPGGEIYVDGNKLTVAPIVFVLMKKNSPRTITIKKDGFKTMEKQFNPDGKPIVIELTLPKM